MATDENKLAAYFGMAQNEMSRSLDGIGYGGGTKSYLFPKKEWDKRKKRKKAAKQSRRKNR